MSNVNSKRIVEERPIALAPVENEPEKEVLMTMFARKNLVQAGFVAGMRFAGFEMEHLEDSREDIEKRSEMEETLMDVFESLGTTREIEPGFEGLEPKKTTRKRKKRVYGVPRTYAFEMGSFGRKNLIQTGFIAGMRFAGFDKNSLDENRTEDVVKYYEMIQSLGDVFEKYGLTRKIEF